ncbi:MAG TPA: hypothetical protein VNT51_09400 [Miltoncostaeaceae bacterium]|nr:hypothetical protein [Miltoncostaeaceae bacterium]
MARRLLVLANETVASPRVVEEVLRRADSDAQVLVVAPVLHRGWLDHFLTSREMEARAQAEARLERTEAALVEAGLEVRGELGDASPQQALDDAVRRFAPDEVVLVTHPPDRSLWLERHLVERARANYEIPVTHMVVDVNTDQGTVHTDPRAQGGRPQEARVRVFMSAPYEDALSIRQGGFRAVAHGGMVDVATRPPDDEDGVVFSVQIPAALIGDVATTTGDSGLRVPADLLDRCGPPVEADAAYLE